MSRRRVIALDLPLLLMWALFLGPLLGVLLLGWRRRRDKRMPIGALFAFLYGLGLIFITHMLALRLGLWRTATTC